jgi:F-type H+-transporting ATPase subunit a
MSFEFIYQAIRFSYVLAALSFGLLYYSVGPTQAYALLLGTLWGGVNLIFIKRLLQSTFIPASRNFLDIVTLFLIKFPLLYLIAYAVITMAALPVWYWVIGFSLQFVVFIFSSVRLVLKSSLSYVLFLPLLFAGASLDAGLTTKVPEVPNLFTLLYAYDPTPLTALLHDWDSILFSVIVATVISVIFCLGASRREYLPSGLQNFLEFCVESFQRFIREIIGPKGDAFVPFLGTIFIYIVTMNWMVLIPFMKSPSSSLSVTVGLAICVFCVVQYLSFKNFGLKGYLYHLAGSPKGFLEWALVPLMFPIELLTQLSRPVTLAFRLFGNVIGEDILIGVSALFGALFLAGFEIPLGLPLQLPFMLFAMMTGLMQALVFTLLSSIYILLAMSDHDENTLESEKE